jgi:hypothetical protein
VTVSKRKAWLVGGLTAAALALIVGWRQLRAWHEEDESEEQEERDLQRDNYWRVQIAISGQGRVKTFIDAFDCASEGAGQHGDCGPKLIRFKELAPPTMEARPAAGWRFDHWDALVREPDGGTHGRAGRMPDGKVYIDGFGYEDTGQLETVTAVFVRIAEDHDGVQP